MASGTTLPEILKQQGMLAPRDLERAVAQQQQTGESLAGLLVRLGLVPEQKLQRVLSKHMGLRLASREQLFRAMVSADLRRRLPRERARAWVVLPLEWHEQDRRLSIVVCDPTDERNLEQVRRAVGVDRMVVSLAPRALILEAIDIIYTNMVGDAAGEIGGAAGELVASRAIQAPSLSGDAEGLDEADTGVELIPGKVSVDPALIRELSARGASIQAEPDTDPTFEMPAATPQATPGPEFHQIVDIGPHRPTLKMKVPWRDEDEDQDTPHDDSLIAQSADRAAQVTPRLGSIPARPATGGQDASRREVELDALMWDLLSAVGVLTCMLEERAVPKTTTSRECARLSRLVGRALGMDRLAVARIAAAAQLYGLDIALREEVGSRTRVDVAAVFEAVAGTPGGLGPTLRMLGARALGIGQGRAREPAGVQVIRLVGEYLQDRDLSGGGDAEAVLERLSQRGIEPRLLDALVQAVKQPKGS